MKPFKMSFCLADSEYMTAVRLAVGAVCALADADVDCAEDMKVCVTESCLIIKGCGFEGVEVSLCGENGVCAVIEGVGGTPHEADNEFSLALVSALVTSFDTDRENGAIKKLTVKL